MAKIRPFNVGRKSRGSAYRVKGVSPRHWDDSHPNENTRQLLRRMMEIELDEVPMDDVFHVRDTEEGWGVFRSSDSKPVAGPSLDRGVIDGICEARNRHSLAIRPEDV